MPSFYCDGDGGGSDEEDDDDGDVSIVEKTDSFRFDKIILKHQNEVNKRSKNKFGVPKLSL